MSSKVQFAYERLRRDILSGALAEGSRVVASQVARAMGISAIPVREALRQLESEGLVRIRPNAGATVSEMNIQQAVELVALQSVVDALATRLSAPFITPTALRELERNIAASEEAVAYGKAQVFVRLNRMFHETIYSVCPYGSVRQAAKALAERHQTLHRISLFTLVPERMAESVEEHRQIIWLLKADPQDLDQIEQAARRHDLNFIRTITGRKGVGLELLKQMEA